MDKRIDRGLELLVVWVLIVSVIGLASALLGYFLAPQVLLASLVLTGFYAWCTRKVDASLGVAPDWRHLILLLLVCLFFRLPAYHYVLGGQDEGLYVNIAHYIERTGGVDVQDTALEKLKDSPYKETYLSENRVADTAYLPGVYAPDPSGKRLEFQFYHLFPVWMALLAGMFGSAFGVYALSLFSCLSVLFFYRLALLVSGSRRVALVAGLLLALNPLHAFFSKFPVTEVPTLAFSLIGFTYLAAFWSRKNSGGFLWLWISSACFGALFFTRISGFMYMPFIIALAIASTIADPNRLRCRAICAWALGTIVLYALSVGYGLHWSGEYASDIYTLSFERIFHKRWRLDLAAIVLASLGGWLFLIFLARSDVRRERMLRQLIGPVRTAIGVIAIIGLLAGIWKIYQLGWTDHFSSDAWLGLRWGLGHSGVAGLKASSLFALIIYLGPLLPACFLFLVVRRRNDPRVEFLRLFASGFFVYVAVLQWSIPYGPYYARYLLSELVPYSMLFVVLVWSCMPPTRWKKVIKGLLGLSLVYMTIASAAQLGKNENDGLYEALSQLLVSVDSSDLVLIDPLPTGLPTSNELKTPILYTFGRNAISVTEKSLANHGYLVALNARYDDIYLLSENEAPPPGFDAEGSTRVKDWAFRPSHFFPHKLMLRGDKRLYLSLLSRPIFPIANRQIFGQAGSWNNWLVGGWSGPEPWGTWSLGQRAELAIDPRQMPSSSHGIRLNFEISAYLTPAHTRQRVEVLVDGVRVGRYEAVYPNMTLSIDADLSPTVLASTRKIRVDFVLPDAVSPKAIGSSADDRVLGIGLISVTGTRLDRDPPTTVRSVQADTLEMK